MRITKFVSAVLAASMTASALLTPSAFQTFAADKTLTFDIRTQDSNEFTVSTTELAAGDVTVPVSIYIPENPGVSAISLKLQINDGQEAENGTLGNYGLYFSDGTFASPYCFDSANEGDSSKAFNTLFVASKMNMS